MTKERMNAQDDSHEATPEPSARRTYQKPRLQRLGDVRDVTMGPTGDNIESGTTRFFQ